MTTLSFVDKMKTSRYFIEHFLLCNLGIFTDKYLKSAKLK